MPTTSTREARSLREVGFRIRPSQTLSPDFRRVLWARSLRAFGDGYVAILLPTPSLAPRLRRFGCWDLSRPQTLLGSALLTLAIGLVRHAEFHERRALLAAGILMAGTGVGFAEVEGFWPLLVIAFVGTLNPSGGDVSLFLPLEHTVIAPCRWRTRSARRRSPATVSSGRSLAPWGGCRSARWTWLCTSSCAVRPWLPALFGF